MYLLIRYSFLILFTFYFVIISITYEMTITPNFITFKLSNLIIFNKFFNFSSLGLVNEHKQSETQKEEKTL